MTEPTRSYAETTKSYAPWTLEQVQSLSAYQQAGFMHPFTCPDRGDGDHRWDLYCDIGVLVPKLAGWYCNDCEYEQTWAWQWMADGSWRTFR